MKSYFLDLRAYRCPLPLLFARKALAQLAPKSQLILQLASDSDLSEIELLCNEMKIEIIEKIQQDTFLQLTLKSRESPPNKDKKSPLQAV